MNKKIRTNKLIEESSPYLLQHAHNSVEWHAWNPETLQMAVNEDKPLLISIGYAACHWCHVMAHETFEDEISAQIMNENFLCVKVDREERPDIDAIYMRAVQTMTGQGGWPLHIFALPDGRPFYGGTYFTRPQWQNLCRQVAQEFNKNRHKLEAYADQLDKGLYEKPEFKLDDKKREFAEEAIKVSVDTLISHFDIHNGGMQGAPKFPMPSLYNFLLDYGILTKDKAVLAQVHLTLEGMAMGGIYDHIGGGFARYSTDSQWKVPHFEKMLYDNAQLLSLYSRAYRHFMHPLFRQTVEETADYLLREMLTEENLFSSSLDADSESEEGKFYVWKEGELREILGELYLPAAEIFNINQYGLWEKDNYILHLRKSENDPSRKTEISLKEFQPMVAEIKKKIFEAREKRQRPALDHKALTSWNGLAISGLADAYSVTHNSIYLQAANNSADRIMSNLRTVDGGLLHAFTDGKAYINGFLEDYSGMTEGLITLYQTTFDEKRLDQAIELVEYTLDHFFDAELGLFYFTSDQQVDITKRTIDLTDGVTASANSSLARSLLSLSHFLGRTKWEEISTSMLNQMADALLRFPSNYSNWASLYLSQAFQLIEISISGEDALDYLEELKAGYQPNTIFAGSTQSSKLPILSDRHLPGKTLIYVCRDKVCAEPVDSTNAALELIK